MAVVGSAVEMADSPSGNFGWKGHDLTRVFIVRTDDLADGPVTVTTADGLPVQGDIYATDTEEHEWAICKSLECKRIGPRCLIWVVMCKFETVESSDKAQTTQQEIDAWRDPLDEVPTVKITQEIFQKPVLGAIDPTITDEEDPGFQKETVAIVNSAGEIFTPPIMRDYTRLCLSISRYEPAEDFEDVFARSLEYQNTINKDIFWNCLPHTCKMNPFGIERVSRTVGETGELKLYLRVTYTIHIQDTEYGWNVRLLDNGNNYIDPLTGIVKPFKTTTGTCYRGLLNGEGAPLTGLDAQFDLPAQFDPDEFDPVYLPAFQIYPEKEFGALNLPQSIFGV